ncbi:hypothetical protein AZE42_00248, partial [Rhizopogon vesiculosus]
LKKFKPEATPEQRQSVRDSLDFLPSKIPAIQCIVTGETVFNPLGHGYDEGAESFFSCHGSVAKLNEYLPHKAHIDHKAFATPYIEDILIFDIELA